MNKKLEEYYRQSKEGINDLTPEVERLDKTFEKMIKYVDERMGAEPKNMKEAKEKVEDLKKLAILYMISSHCSDKIIVGISKNIDNIERITNNIDRIANK